MNRAWEQENCMQNFGWKASVDLGANGRIILKGIFKLSVYHVSSYPLGTTSKCYF
jgi:hypothetical protein